MPYIYISKCANNSYDTGSTIDLYKRFAEHQNGLGAKHTAKYQPVELVYCEYYDRVDDAYAREKQVQDWSRGKKEALINDTPHTLPQFAECQNNSHHRRYENT